MSKITNLGRLPLDEQKATLAAIYRKVGFIRDPANHLTTNADLPDLDIGDCRRAKQHIEAAVLFNEGGDAEDCYVGSSKLIQPEGRRDQTGKQLASELASYEAKFEKMAYVPATRAAERSDFACVMEEARLTSMQTVDYRTACAKLKLDPANPIIGSGASTIPLQAWQVTGLHCLIYGAHSTQRGHMLSDRPRYGENHTDTGSRGPAQGDAAGRVGGREG